MIITCPSCSAQFAVPVAAIGAAGRTVRCSACGHQWFQDPPSQVTPPLSTAPPPPPDAPAAAEPVRAAPDAAPRRPEPAADGDTEADAVTPNEPPEGPETDDFEAMMAEERRRPPHINLPAVPTAPPRRRGVMLGWLALVVFLVALVGGAVLGRDRIVAFWPPAVKAYDLVGLDVTEAAIREIPAGLSFPDPPALSFEREGDADILVIEVTVTNTGEETSRLPPLEMSLRDAGGETVDLWVHDTGWPRIAPGETLVVVTRRADPPTEATDFHMEPAAIPRSERPTDPPADGTTDAQTGDADPPGETPDDHH